MTEGFDPRPLYLTTDDERSRWWLRRMPVAWHPDRTDVFCGPGARASGVLKSVVWKTDHFYVVANHRPVAQSHLLVIPRWHIPSLGSLPYQWAAELDGIQQRIRDYHRATFGAETLFYENDITWQSVHHAHIHAVPLPSGINSAPPMAGAISAPTWSDVRAYFNHGQNRYHLIQVGNGRRLFPGGSADAIAANAWIAHTLNIPRAADGHWNRQLDDAAAKTCGDRFRAWIERNVDTGRGMAA